MNLPSVAFSARTVITELLRESRKEPIKRERLQAYFDRLDRRGMYQPLSFIGFIREQSVVHLFGYNCPCYQTKDFGPVYIVGTGKNDGKGFRVTPPREIFKYEYRGDILVIRTAHLNDPDHLKDLSLKDQIWMVPPIHREITDEDKRALRVPNMNSRFLCSYFFIRHPGLPLHTFARVDYRQDVQSLVRFNEIPGGIEFGLEERYMEAVTRSIDMHFRVMKVEDQQRHQAL